MAATGLCDSLCLAKRSYACAWSRLTERPLNESFSARSAIDLVTDHETPARPLLTAALGESVSLYVCYLRPNQSVAMPRNEKNPTTSVTVVTNTPDEIAGSARK